MPAQWTGVLIGEIHNAGLTIKAVANEAGMNPKYVSQVLNGEADAPKAEARLRSALDRLNARKEDNETNGEKGTIENRGDG